MSEPAYHVVRPSVSASHQPSFESAMMCVSNFFPTCFLICGSCSMFWLSTAKPTPHPCMERYMISAKSSSLVGAVKGAIIGAGVAATRRLARELHETHRGHHFLLQNAHTHFGIFFFGEFVAEIFAHEAYIAVNGLYPSLAPSFFGYPFRIGAQIDELAECVVGKIFLLSSASFRTRSGISICAARNCARLSR